ncbi:Tyrosine recombinase XerC [Pontiella desulfatans]|uniref:Tyrosine recombinase XerC n=1 Tax=Pontiella desulfatans TaxID=2750659 RepID=A0A6C2U2I2_PONDE|nr:tyrosine-type recombinase/integrase [Pontiella desulfatans]VGO14113.1 Tyrosine recombinase XerC [Pontiella desulfatans]
MHSETFRIPDDLPPSLCILAEQFCTDAFRIRGITLETIRLEICYLCRFFRHFGPPASSDKLFQALSPGSISDFLQDYARAYSPGSLAGMQTLLRSFLRFAHRTSRIGRDLAELVPIRKRRQLGMVPRGLPDECIERLRSSIDRSTTEGMRDSAIICLLATYGVRGVQIRRLRLDDIDWPNERIHFPAAKGGRPVEQHLIAEAGNLLSEYVLFGRPESESAEVFLMLCEPFGPIPAANELSEVIRRRIRRLGMVLPDGVSYGTHGFRHAFASRMVGKVPFKDLVDQLGHRDSACTLVYSKVDLDGLRQAALPWPGGGR